MVCTMQYWNDSQIPCRSKECNKWHINEIKIYGNHSQHFTIAL